MIKPCRYPGCTSTYAGEHTWHKPLTLCAICGAPAHASETDDRDRCEVCRAAIYLADWRTGEVIRRATRDEIARAARDPHGDFTYAGTYGNRGAYLVRVLDDENETTVPLDVAEIVTLARAWGLL